MKINLPLIKEERKKIGYNIDKMAELLGLTNGSMYWKRENGDYKFKAEEVMSLSVILNIPLAKLFLSDSYSKIEINSVLGGPIMDVGRRIREYREKRGMEQLELAKRINISQSKMNKIETGFQKRLEPEIISDIADVFQVSTDELLGRTKKDQDLAAHRSDNHMDDLPDEAIKAIEEYKDFIRQKFAKNNKKGNA